MGLEQEDAEALRRRLYRPGASAADLATYLHVADAETPSVPDPDRSDLGEREPGPSLRPFVIGAACVAAAALLGGLLLSGGLTVPSSTATPTAPAAAAVAVTTTGPDGSWMISFSAAPVLDGGERDHARGVSVAEGPERYRYTVSPGDTVAAIARRFQLCTSDVLVSLPYGFDPATLPAGQTLELARLTDQGGAATC